MFFFSAFRYLSLDFDLNNVHQKVPNSCKKIKIIKPKHYLTLIKICIILETCLFKTFKFNAVFR